MKQFLLFFALSGVAAAQSIQCKWDPSSSPNAQKMMALRPGIDKLTSYIADKYVFKTDVFVHFVDEGEFTEVVYEPKTDTVTIPYSYFEHVKRFAVQDTVAAQTGVVQFELTRALSDALIVQQAVPVTGRHDDDLDQCACFMLENWSKPGIEVLDEASGSYFGQYLVEDERHTMGSGRTFKLQQLRTLAEALDHADPGNHPLMEIVGYGEDKLPRMRDEHAKWSRSWSHLLRPYRKGAIPDPAPGELPLLGSMTEGKVYVEYRKSALPYGEAMRKLFLTHDPGWNDLAARMNREFVFPRDLQIVFKDIHTVNAYYTPGQHRIVFGYELFKFADDAWAKTVKDPKKRQQLVLETCYGVMLHELCHALIGELGVNATGREEDAADEFSAVLLNELPKHKSCLKTFAQFWKHFSDARGPMTTEQLIESLVDEHSLDDQRYTHLMAMVVEDDILEHLDFAMNELSASAFQVVVRDAPRRRAAWKTLLNPHRKAPVSSFTPPDER